MTSVADLSGKNGAPRNLSIAPREIASSNPDVGADSAASGASLREVLGDKPWVDITSAVEWLDDAMWAMIRSRQENEALRRLCNGIGVSTRPPFGQCVLYWRLKDDCVSEVFSRHREEGGLCPNHSACTGIWMGYVVATNHGDFRGAAYKIAIYFLEDGSLWWYPVADRASLEWRQDWELVDTTGIAPQAIVALAFLNQPTVAVKPSATFTRHVRRRRERNEEWCGPIRHHTLVIDVPPPTHTDKAAPSGGAGGFPLHDVRGHWAVYDERPLFGRLRGTFWIPHHRRGDPTYGVVTKDYRIGPIEEDQ